MIPHLANDRRIYVEARDGVLVFGEKFDRDNVMDIGRQHGWTPIEARRFHWTEWDTLTFFVEKDEGLALAQTLESIAAIRGGYDQTSHCDLGCQIRTITHEEPHCYDHSRRRLCRGALGRRGTSSVLDENDHGKGRRYAYSPVGGRNCVIFEAETRCGNTNDAL